MERFQMILDASVIAKWFLVEEGSDEALQLRDEYVKGTIDIAVPELLLYEVANVLRYKDFSEEDVKKAMLSLMDMDLFIAGMSHLLMERTVEISMECGITIYDAAYVALAESLSTELVTADSKLYEKTKEKYRVRLL